MRFLTEKQEVGKQNRWAEGMKGWERVVRMLGLGKDRRASHGPKATLW